MKETIADLKEKLDQAKISYKKGKKKTYYKNLLEQHQARKRSSLPHDDVLQQTTPPKRKKLNTIEEDDFNIEIQQPIVVEEMEKEERHDDQHQEDDEGTTTTTLPMIKYESERLLLKRAKEIYDEEQQQASLNQDIEHTESLIDRMTATLQRQKYSYIHLIIAFSFIGLLFISIFLSNSKEVGSNVIPTFCDSDAGAHFYNDAELKLLEHGFSCDPCPLHGYCIDGQLELCEEPYVKEGLYTCRLNTSEHARALETLHQVARTLNKQLGRYECGMTTQKPIMSLHDLDASETLLVYLNHTKTSKRYGVHLNNTTIEPTRAILPKTCILKRRLFENQALLFVLLILFVCLFIINRYREGRLMDRVQLEDIMGIILTVIREQARLEEDDEDRWIYVSQLKELLDEEYGQECDVTTRLWPEIEQAARSHPRILKKVSFTDEELWKWS